MDNQFNHMPEDNVPDNDIVKNDNSEKSTAQDAAADNNVKNGSENNSTQQNVYTDPNAGYTQYSQGQAQYQRQDQYQGANQYQYYNNTSYQNTNSYQNAGQSQYENPYQNSYQNGNGYYNNNPNSSMDMTPMTMGDWVLTLLALMIPCAGIVLYFVWAFGSHGNINRRNFCRAQLAILGVVLALYLVLILVLGVSFAGAMSTY